eukprot:CAMPEP_0115873864 /NCGR_PEP_ID=MMETSP0287-20121206/24224_1 /TAXON_ID=412157 /ORGANISM="Chrysochromulina rotalis, Strain UIO044" /LENGTH=40 /DNA_ID= /DNA_START= /DNA_END= /DNA_ORIENTATION=
MATSPRSAAICRAERPSLLNRMRLMDKDACHAYVASRHGH